MQNGATPYSRPELTDTVVYAMPAPDGMLTGVQSDAASSDE